MAYYQTVNSNVIAKRITNSLRSSNLYPYHVSMEELLSYRQPEDGGGNIQGWLLHKLAERFASQKKIQVVIYSHPCISSPANQYTSRCYMINKEMLPENTPPISWIVSVNEYVVLTEVIAKELAS